MAGNPFYAGVSPDGAPDPVTPAAGPADAAGYATVTPHGRGTAPYDIAAPLDDAAIQAAWDGAGAVAAAGVSVYPGQGTRQREAQELLDSPQGFSSGGGTSGYDITAGWSGEPDESWANNVQMPGILETPIQGTGDYPGTMQDGVPTYGT